MYRKSIVVLGTLMAMSTAAVAQRAQPDATLPVPNPGAPGAAVEAAPGATAPMPTEATQTPLPGAQPMTEAARTPLPGDQPKMATGQFIPHQQASQTLASDLIGQNVLDSSGQQIAKVSDIILDEQSRIAGVILATGGFLGIGEHNVGVELNQLTPNPDSKGYVVNLSRDAIENAPPFKTLAAVQSERDAETLRQQQATPPVPASPAPAVPAQ